MLAIVKRELKAYFQTPLGYIFMSLFLLIAGILFVLGNVFEQNPRFAGYLGSIMIILVLAIPILTMRLLSDEMRAKTDQLLITSPIRITDIVLGKFFAAFIVYFLTILLTGLYFMVLSFHGDVDGWETLGSYIGFFLLGGSFIAIGLFISATTENQVVAAIVTLMGLLISWIMDFIQQAVPSDPLAGFIFLVAVIVALSLWIYFSTKNLLIPIVLGVAGAGAALIVFLVNQAAYLAFIGKTLEWLSLVKRYTPFSRGVLSLDSVVYYLTISAFFIFLTVRLVEKKRWS